MHAWKHEFHNLFYYVACKVGFVWLSESMADILCRFVRNLLNSNIWMDTYIWKKTCALALKNTPNESRRQGPNAAIDVREWMEVIYQSKFIICNQEKSAVLLSETCAMAYWLVFAKMNEITQFLEGWWAGEHARLHKDLKTITSCATTSRILSPAGLHN